MPKKCYGVYIRTERSLKKIIDIMNAKYNNELIIRNIDEFRDLLVEDGPGSSITLVAQWERIPEGYTAPVTGVE